MRLTVFFSLHRLKIGLALCLLSEALGLAPCALADSAAFDLVGPKVDVRVQRAGVTLPIAEVPSLQAGDRLWIHADLPDSQSVRYLMVVAFLRGATNPPPDSWFTRVETWTRPVHEEGVYVTVPEEAEEALVLLAPETGGAFGTLRNAVRGKPGAFVRAAQDLEQAGLDRARLEKYLDTVRQTSTNNPEDLKSRTTLLARSLNIRLDQQCFDKPTAQQVPCLTQNTDQLVLDDAHSQTMVATLTSGASSDLLAQISATPSARGGYYSAYVGAVVDVARILSTAHTAQYQYIPALAVPKQNELHLRLNNPPSFRNPKSVLVIALPLVQTSPVPPLRALDATQVFCAGKPSLLPSGRGRASRICDRARAQLRSACRTQGWPRFRLAREGRSGARWVCCRYSASKGGIRPRWRSNGRSSWNLGISLLRRTSLPLALPASRTMDCGLQRCQRTDRRP